MAEAFAVGAAVEALKKVSSLVASEVVRAWGYEDKLTDLKRDLELINAKLRDAERQKGTEAVTVWLKHLKLAVDEADDVLDEIDYEQLRRDVKDRKWIARKVSSLPSLKKLSFRIQMGHKIGHVCKKLSEINNRANELGLQNVQPVAPVPDSLFRETDPYLDEFTVFGREKEELQIIQLLTQSRKEERLNIVPIVGMGGIGKTTLAKSIYNHPTVQQHFQVKAWLCVSVKIEMDTLLAKIYETLVGEECKSRSKTDLIKDFQSKMGSKTYFLVLDDVWDEERAHWDEFKSCMLKANSQIGSGILVTTRSSEIGKKAMSEDFYALESLPDDRCWSIFKERAFGVGRSPMPELEEIGRDIVKNCRGLPLLVKVMGCMLRNCNDKDKWLSIKGSKVWDLEEEGVRVQNILKLSFDNLPNSTVKQCFLYCSIFKKDTVLKREKLIRLWMALGLVHEDERRNKAAEEVGNGIFQILVGSSLFQGVKTDEYGYVTGSIHDFVHDLSLSLCKEESLCLVAATSDDIERIPQVKHLSILPQDGTWVPVKNLLPVLFKNNITRTLHSLMIFKGKELKNISFDSFKNLRILKLKGYGIWAWIQDKIDDSIGELVHLRYLDLSKNPITALPNSISKLYHLQTLNLFGCFHLKNFPQDMSNLTSLRHLMYRTFADISICNVGRLTSLRTLSSFRVGREKGHQISELGPLKHLSGELCITNIKTINSKEDAAKAELSRKTNLHGVHFYWGKYRQPGTTDTSARGVNRKDKDVLEGLQPNGSLKILTIQDFSGDKFPAWVEKMAIHIEGKWTPLNKLVKIRLDGCNNCVYLPMLEDLPLLRDLVLEYMYSLTCLSTSPGKPLSPSLRSLKLNEMKRLVQWNSDPATTNSSMMLSPVLKELTIQDCPSIIHLDESHPHPTLVSLKIFDCKNLKSFTSIQGLTSLETLDIIGCLSLIEIPYLPNSEGHPLKSLSITNCTKLTCLPCELFNCFSFLKELRLGPFSKELHSFPSLQGIENLSNLSSLRLHGWEHWESIPEQVQHLTSLTSLGIKGFGIRELPTWLSNMSSSKYVSFDDCKRLNEKEIERGKPRESTLITAHLRGEMRRKLLNNEATKENLSGILG